MDPGGSELDNSLPQPENPCLIVEDSQPDSVALEDDPESSYRALLSRRLSSLQPTSHSPVLELISSPAGSRSSQIDSQLERSQSCSQSGSAVAGPTDVSPAPEEESQVMSICPLPNKKIGAAAEDTSMDSRADSTTHCAQSEEGTSQFGFLELSESQGLGDEVENTPEVKGDVTVPQTDSERHSKPAEQKLGIGTSASGRQDNKSTRSEVTSSSSSEPLLQSVREMRVQALLHSQGFHTTEDHQDSEVLSSQEDLFDDAADKTGAGVDSTVSELDNRGVQPLTPAHTLGLLHLSGQGTLVQQSLSQSSTDYVAPTQDQLSQAPFIVPNSPTGPEAEGGADEPMETDAVSKPRPTASTPVSQNSPDFVLKKTLSVPSQPEFSHDVFVATQSQEAASSTSSSVAARDPQRKPVVTPSLCGEKPRPSVESNPSTLSLGLTLNTESSDVAPLASQQQPEDDSQATQIEGLDEALGIDTSDSVMSRCSQRSERNCVSSSPKTAAQPKAASAPDSLKHSGEGALSQRSEVQVSVQTAKNVRNVNVSHASGVSPMGSRADKVHGSQGKTDSMASSCVQQTPPTTPRGSLASMSQSVFSQTSSSGSVKVTGSELNTQSLLKRGQSSGAPSQLLSLDQDVMDEGNEAGKEEGEEERMMEEGESTLGPETSALGLALSQSQLLSPEPTEEEMEGSSLIVVSESERSPGLLEKGDALSLTQQKKGGSQPTGSKVSVSSNGHGSQSQSKDVRVAPDSLSQAEKKGPEAKGVKDKSLSDSSGEIPFHFTLPKEGELIGPAMSATPPLINQLKQTPRHSSTPIEKPAAVGNVSVASCDMAAAESGEDSPGKGDGKLSLRMKLVTPVEEGSSEHFCLQKPTLSDEEGSVVKVTTVAKAVTSPSVFSRVRQVHRQLEVEEDNQRDGTTTPAGSQRASLGCNSLPSSQKEAPTSPQQELSSPVPRREPSTPAPQAAAAGEREVRESPEPTTPTRTATGHQTSFENSNDTIILSPPSKRCQKAASQPPGLDAQGFRSPSSRGEADTPSFRRTGSGPSHRRHIRTIQEVRTTVTRIITDVYYEDGKEVDRKVTEESEEPVVDCQVMDSDISPCRTGSSLTSGDLADVSSLSSKASSLQRSSSGTSSTTGGHLRADFVMPPSRGASRGARGGGTSGMRGVGTPGQPQSSSEDEPYTRLVSPPGLPDSPMDAELPSHSDSLRSSPEAAGMAGRGLVGLRVVAKWSSNHYFYSGRITRDVGEGRFRLRFDDGYECEVLGKDILLCDPIPLETEVTAILEGDYFSIGTVKGNKTEDGELYYSVEREGNTHWHKRSSVVLSLEQGNKLREQHSLGPYEPSTPLAKASDISLDNLVEGKRRRTGTPGGQSTPNHSSNSSASPRTPGPSGKRKLLSSEDDGRTPAKRGRRGPGSRAAQRVGVCNTSDSAPEPVPGQSTDVLAQTHGPLPQNASLFQGFAFMLTASSECDRLSNKLASDDEEEYVETAPYHRRYTESQLQAGGGFILSDFNEEQCKAAYQSLLIADQHCRTSKYLLCVASGVPCVSHMWVRDCCKDNKLLNYRNYLLPAGVGPDNSIVEWHPRAYPFKTLRALLVFEEPVELWSQLLTLSGASTVKHYQADKDGSDIPTGKFDLVITDRACPPLVQKSVQTQKLPLLSAEWLIQSLICGERLGYQSKPQFSHDFLS